MKEQPAPNGASQRIADFFNSYARLPETFFARLMPTTVAEPRLVKFNEPLAKELGLDVAGIREIGAALFSGNTIPAGAEPIAMAYAGHQFGQFVPQLGDGRAILLGEVVDRNDIRRDIQLKGAGRTPFSRQGDGRAALGPVLREYLVSEAMHALGVPTTRALAVVTTGEVVYRDTPLPGAVLARVASSHVRVGTFEYFAARADLESIKQLADYVIKRHYPKAMGAEQPYQALLEAVVDRQALLVAKWMHVGFIHGVMNTDNMAVSGETIDFGPCAFMDAYDPATVFSAIDESGRYAYANQPRIAQWNLARFAEALLPILNSNEEGAIVRANEIVSDFSLRFEAHWLGGMRNKLGLYTAEADDLDLVIALLGIMHDNAADFTLTFRRLSDAAICIESDLGVGALFADPGAYRGWAARWRLRLAREPMDPVARARAMRQVNPAFIPRNHRVEEALRTAIEKSDFRLFHELSSVLARPYEDDEAFARYGEKPEPGEAVFTTFCGT